jgi:hypothetical protein
VGRPGPSDGRDGGALCRARPGAPWPPRPPRRRSPAASRRRGWRGDTARPHPYMEGDDAASARRAMGRTAAGASDIYARSIAAMNAGGSEDDACALDDDTCAAIVRRGHISGRIDAVLGCRRAAETTRCLRVNSLGRPCGIPTPLYPNGYSTQVPHIGAVPWGYGTRPQEGIGRRVLPHAGGIRYAASRAPSYPSYLSYISRDLGTDGRR